MAYPSQSESAVKQWHISRDPLTDMHLHKGSSDLGKMIAYYFHDMPPEAQAEIEKRLEALIANDLDAKNTLLHFQENQVRYAHKMDQVKRQILEMVEMEDQYEEYQQRPAFYRMSKESQIAQEEDEEMEAEEESQSSVSDYFDVPSPTKIGHGKIFAFIFGACAATAISVHPGDPSDQQVAKDQKPYTVREEMCKKDSKLCANIQKMETQAAAPDSGT